MERYVAGRLNGVHAEPGTILGPKDSEWMVVLDNDDRGVTVGYATTHDLAAAAEVESPRSVTEHLMRQHAARSRR